MTTQQVHREKCGTLRVRYPLLASPWPNPITKGREAVLNGCASDGPRTMRDLESKRIEVKDPSRLLSDEGNAGPGRASRVLNLQHESGKLMEWSGLTGATLPVYERRAVSAQLTHRS